MDLSIFDSLFEKRPELKPENLQKDLDRYYLPYLQKLVNLKKEKSPNQGLIVGVSAIQGAGKTTQGEILEILLGSMGHSTDALSIDDHYLTHKQLCELRGKDPRYIRRGVTHDIDLATRDLKKLQKMKDGESILMSGYDKGVQSGDGDRLRWINPIQGLTVKAKVVHEELMVNKQLQHTQALQLVSAEFNGQNLVLLDNMGSDLPLLDHFLPRNLIQFLIVQTCEVTISLEGEKVVFVGTGQISIDPKELPNGWRVVSKKT